MHILEAALAFAITMLVLSLICSSFVEIIHRIFSMREAGLKYVLEQMFDQVLAKYVTKFGIEKSGSQFVGKSIETLRDSFVTRMSANRAPMGVTPNPTPTANKNPLTADTKPAWEISLWSGRDLTSLSPAEFMERLGTIDIGETIKEANKTLGTAAADAADAVLKDIAQKFEAFGKEASAYFEGRARLLSVIVAIVLAFAIRVDAIELFNTYLRDPNARNKVIEQTQAVTAQYKAATDAALAAKAAGASDADVKAQIDAIQKDLKAAIDNASSTAKQYADLGLPIGWTKENASLNPWAPACWRTDGTIRLVKGACREDETHGEVGGWNALKLALSLLLGGILVGLGGPFWYNAVSGLSNIRNIARELTGGSTKGDVKAPAGVAPDAGTPPAEENPDKAQPTTPVGTFKVAQRAR